MRATTIRRQHGSRPKTLSFWRLFAVDLLGSMAIVQQVTGAWMTRGEALRELGLTPRFTQEELKAAYCKCSLHTHPDTAGGFNEAFKRVSEAYQLLAQQEGSSLSSSWGGSTSNGWGKDAGDSGRDRSSNDCGEDRGGHDGGGSDFGASDGSDAEDTEFTFAEELFFDMLSNLFDDDKVETAINNLFKNAKPNNLWVKIMREGLKISHKAAMNWLQNDKTVIQVEGVTMTGKDFRRLRQRLRERAKAKKRRKDYLNFFDKSK